MDSRYCSHVHTALGTLSWICSIRRRNVLSGAIGEANRRGSLLFVVAFFDEGVGGSPVQAWKYKCQPNSPADCYLAEQGGVGMTSGFNTSKYDTGDSDPRDSDPHTDSVCIACRSGEVDSHTYVSPLLDHGEPAIDARSTLR